MDELEGGSCERVYSDPTREKSKSAAELAVKALELRMKGIMLESSLPVTFWKMAYDEAIEISNMYPITKNVTSRDGDAIRPLEEISNGRISRQFINKIWVKGEPPTPTTMACNTHMEEISGVPGQILGYPPASSPTR